MANEEQVQILKRGVGAWNKWRSKHYDITPNLRAANLCDADLKGANLKGADLRGANLNGVNLTPFSTHSGTLDSANLRGADLSNADFRNAKLRGADFQGAILKGADLFETDLSNADLSLANLSGAQLHYAELNRTNLSGSNLRRASLQYASLRSTNVMGANINLAITSETAFIDIDFRQAKGLEGVLHRGPSVISISTLYRSEGQIPEVFLRGCGLRDWEIENTKLYRTELSRNQIVDLTYRVIDLRSDPHIQFNSCFISYSSKDEEFARRLYLDLQENGVRCWFAPEDMKIGARIRNSLDDSIRLHDKLLLILSETSVASQWIEQEVETALEKEREQGYDVLFPVMLDNTVLSMRSGWPALIKKTRHIGDFCHWDNPDKYRKVFNRLLTDLRISS